MRRLVRLPLLAIALFAWGGCNDPGDPDPVTGSLQLSIGGLPDTIDAAITLTGPNGYSAPVTRAQTLASLIPGTYTIAANQVVTGVATFVPAFQSLVVNVGANALSQAAVIYSVTTGSIAISVTGTPIDVPWKVLVAGPAGYRDSVSTNRTLGNLVPGIYFVSATEVRKGLSVYAPRQAEFPVTIPASITPANAVVTYSLITGTLSLHVNGLASGTSGNVNIAGPSGYSVSETSSVTLEGLRQGLYEISASAVGTGAAEQVPTPLKQNLVVIPGSTSVVSVNYRLLNPPAGVNFAIDAVHLQQVVQTYGGAVPTVAGRDALLRVFVRASEPNVASPAVRVRLYDGLQLLATHSVPAAAAGVPTVVEEGQLAASWNLPISGSMIRPGLRILTDVDPQNVIAESDENDNVWPSSGSPLAIDVRTVPPLNVRLVPVTQSATGLTGNITIANLAQYEAAARQLLPISGLTMDVRSPFTTNAPALDPTDANGAWVQVLSELNALRTAEGNAAHYYGVVKVPYPSGTIGISYLPSFVALGFDSLPKAAPTFVHELGHNFGRLHSRGCGAGGPDANYPYQNGVIGVFGIDVSTGTLIPPSTPDIMSYCDGRWISDYTYSGIMGFRASQTSATSSIAAAQASRPGLLLWGRVGAKEIVLEPAYEINAPAKLPATRGPHRIEIFGESGEVLFGLSFVGDRTVDAPGGVEEHFAFVVPLDSLGGRIPAQLRMVAAGRTATRTSPTARTADQLANLFAPVAQRLTGSRVRLRWTDAPGRGILIRNAATGAILSFASGGVADVVTTGSQLDLTFSDGVRSVRRSVLVR